MNVYQKRIEKLKETCSCPYCQKTPEWIPKRIYSFHYNQPTNQVLPLKLKINLHEQRFLFTLKYTCPNCRTTEDFELVWGEDLKQYTRDLNYDYSKSIVRTKKNHVKVLHAFNFRIIFEEEYDETFDMHLKCPKCHSEIEVFTKWDEYEKVLDEVDKFLAAKYPL